MAIAKGAALLMGLTLCPLDLVGLLHLGYRCRRLRMDSIGQERLATCPPCPETEMMSQTSETR